MPVSSGFRAFALEQLGRILPVTARAMFGGVGIYTDGLFFALLDDDVLYLKVDDANRPDYEALGLGPFLPGGDPAQPMQYYPPPAELLEDVDRLEPWVTKAVAVARRKRKPSARNKPSGR